MTKREAEVWHLLALGASNKEIARTLVIAHGTVKRHISKIFLERNANRRTQAIARARTLRIIPDFVPPS